MTTKKINSPNEKPSRKGTGGKPSQKSEGERTLIQSIVAQNYLQGLGVPAIYEIVKERGITIHIKTLYTYLTDLKKEWMDNRLGHMDEQVSRELAKIDNLERIAWEEFYDSKGYKTKEQEKISFEAPVGRAKIGKQKGRETLSTKEKQNGSNDYLKTVQWCIDKRLEIIGFGKLHLNVQQTNNTTVIQENKVNQQFNGGFSVMESDRDHTQTYTVSPLSKPNT